MADDDNNRSRDSGRERDRSRRGDRPSRFSEGNANVRDRSAERGNDRGGRKSSNCRVYVSNISYEYRWQDLKDLFREKVGDVAFVELFVDDGDKPKGCGIVEFSDSESVKKCMEVMHRFELNGRKLVIKEDFGNERDKHGNIINGRRNRDRDRMMDKDWDDRGDNRRGGNWDNNPPPSLLNLMKQQQQQQDPSDFKWGNTYGLSPQFLDSLNINRPLVNRVFVANLDYKVDEKKLREVFKLCGKMVDVELYHDKEGNSRGFAVVEYDHPVESVQAISMLHNQMLYDRPMTVRMDRIDHDVPLKLPEGLKGIGMGLGMNGEPLRDVSRNLPSSNGGNNMGGGPNGAGNSGPGILGAVPTQASLQALTGNLGNLSNVVNNSTLAGLGGPSAAALQASLAGVQGPFLSNSLNNLGGNLGSGLSGDMGLGSLTSSNLNPSLTNLSNSLALAGAGSGLNTSGNMGNSLMSARLGGGNSGDNRDYNRGDNSGGNYLMGGGGGNNPGNQGGNRNYSSGNRDYDGRNSYDMMSMKSDLADNFRQSSLYSTVNNGSQARTTGNASKGNSFSETIIVSNLPISASWKMMREKFNSIGDIQYVEMKPEENQAIIRFASQWHAERAIKHMDRQRIDGRTIDVRFFY